MLIQVVVLLDVILRIGCFQWFLWCNLTISCCYLSFSPEFDVGIFLQWDFCAGVATIVHWLWHQRGFKRNWRTCRRILLLLAVLVCSVVMNLLTSTSSTCAWMISSYLICSSNCIFGYEFIVMYDYINPTVLSLWRFRHGNQLLACGSSISSPSTSPLAFSLSKLFRIITSLVCFEVYVFVLMAIALFGWVQTLSHSDECDGKNSPLGFEFRWNYFSYPVSRADSFRSHAKFCLLKFGISRNATVVFTVA